jgi:UDP-GlcNAc:undecaprenyl-phosphate/decaprenyl-phosphate GlcNAc-1-phosphate transferase
MVLSSTVLDQLLSFQFSHNLFLLLVGGGCAFLLSYVFILGIILLFRKTGWVRPAEPGRSIDRVPRLGGLGIYLAFVIASLIFYIQNPDPAFLQKEKAIYWLFLIGSALIVLVHAYDDIKPLKPLPKLFAQTIAVIIIMGPFLNNMGPFFHGPQAIWFNTQFNGVLLFGFSNPFQVANVAPNLLPWYQRPEITLFISPPPNTFPDITWLVIPAVLFTWFWMVGMMNTVNLIDGVDGLAGGVVAITSICITLISWKLGQYSIAILAAIFTGAILGFLLHNWNPSRIIMGDSGSQFLGIGLAVLSIMGGAKAALALMVLGIPILDVAIVMINRVRRGQSPLHYDTTHLHHRLQATGLSPRQICYVMYAFTTFFGVLALNLLPIYKLVGIALVIVAMIGVIIWIDYRQRQRGTPIRLDGPENGPRGPKSGQGSEAQKTGDPLEQAPVIQDSEATNRLISPPHGSIVEQLPVQLPL